MNMKKHLVAAIFLTGTSVAVLGFLTKHINKTAQGFALVELFTSEGCSSCPPADEAVAEIAREYKGNVFILGFHVDYWNYLGWKDTFSSNSFSNRQKQYASILNLNSVYTPEIIVNGKTEFVGSDKNKLNQTILKELSGNTMMPIDISAKCSDGRNVVVSLKTENSTNEIINIALVQLQAQSDVKRGENNGRQLHHINVVRDLKTIDAASKQQSLNFILPAGLAAKDFSLIAFAQNKNNWHVDGASQVNIQ
jgi:hypothetical protein